MEQEREVTRAIGAYLERVAAELGGVPADEKDAILQEIESHIYDALQKRCGKSPSIEELDIVLGEMDAPQSYRRNQAPAGIAVTQGPRFCKYPIVGAVFASLSLILGILLWVCNGAAEEPPTLLKYIMYATLVPGLAAPVVTTALGLVGVSAIRASRGRLIGMPLAVAMSLLYPLTGLTAMLTFGVGHSARIFAPGLDMPRMHNLVTAAACLGLVVAVVVDIFIISRVWRWASRPVAPGEPV